MGEEALEAAVRRGGGARGETAVAGARLGIGEGGCERAVDRGVALVRRLGFARDEVMEVCVASVGLGKRKRQIRAPSAGLKELSMERDRWKK